MIAEDVAKTEVELIDRAADRLFHDPLPTQIAIAVPHPIRNLRFLPILVSLIIVIVDEQLTDPEERNGPKDPPDFFTHYWSLIIISYFN